MTDATAAVLVTTDDSFLSGKEPLTVRRESEVYPATHGLAVEFFVRLGSYQNDKNIK